MYNMGFGTQTDDGYSYRLQLMNDRLDQMYTDLGTQIQEVHLYRPQSMMQPKPA